MNSDCKRYLGELKTLIPSAGKYEKKFLKNMKENMEAFSDNNPNITYSDICNHFGTPKDILIDYFSNVDAEYLVKRLKFVSILRKCVIAALLIIIFTCSVKTGLYYKSYQDVQEHQPAYTIETIGKPIIE